MKKTVAGVLRHSQPFNKGEGFATRKKFLKGTQVAKMRVAQQSSRAVGKILTNKYRGPHTAEVLVLEDVMGTTNQSDRGSARAGRVAEMSLDLAGY